MLFYFSVTSNSTNILNQQKEHTLAHKIVWAINNYKTQLFSLWPIFAQSLKARLTRTSFFSPDVIYILINVFLFLLSIQLTVSYTCLYPWSMQNNAVQQSKPPGGGTTKESLLPILSVPNSTEMQKFQSLNSNSNSTASTLWSSLNCN